MGHPKPLVLWRLLVFGGFNGKKHLKSVEAFNEERTVAFDFGFMHFKVNLPSGVLPSATPGHCDTGKRQTSHPSQRVSREDTCTWEMVGELLGMPRKPS